MGSQRKTIADNGTKYNGRLRRCRFCHIKIIIIAILQTLLVNGVFHKIKNCTLVIVNKF